MTNQVAFYARSSNDAHDVSCDSQLREFEALADEAGEVVVETRVDKAVKHSEAQGFIELVRLATAASPPPFSKVYVYDTARISRDHVRQAVLRRKMIDAGVEVYFVKVPQTNTWIDELVISVLSILDQVHAEKSRQDARLRKPVLMPSRLSSRASSNGSGWRRM